MYALRRSASDAELQERDVMSKDMKSLNGVFRAVAAAKALATCEGSQGSEPTLSANASMPFELARVMSVRGRMPCQCVSG